VTPQELHSRILLHELRTILLDETREGSRIPQRWKDYLLEGPHEPTRYLILADWLDEQEDPLGELSRIQVQLIGLLPVDLFMFAKEHYAPIDKHPFLHDWFACFPMGYPNESTPFRHLVSIRASAARDLYDYWPPSEHLPVEPEKRPRNRTLGRTTRMLTDILRYCALNQGKHVLVRHPSAEPLRGSYEKVMQELLAGTPVEGMHIYKNHIHFGRPEMTDIIRTHRITERQIVNAGGIKELQLYVRQELARVGFDINRHIQVEQELASRSWLGVQTFPPDITFTDHACQYHRVITGITRESALTIDELHHCRHERIEPHECPYASEIHGDNRLCTCCDFCADECARDI
jgi:uncharacterized protein (TIGR02996 family)